jgi:16S rRNA (adenine1518-N6/adenine1519-N6)-dimethyltransferase
MSSPALKRRYGQHHLRGGGLCRPLLDFLRAAGERVLEIGPGGGVLTAELIRAGARVVACEVDAEWAFALRRRFAGAAAPSIAVADALDLDYRRLVPPTLVAGNLPFNVATPIIEAVLAHPEVIPRAAFMVQKEVAERLVARPGGPAYGSFTVLAAARAEVRYLGTVRPGSFRPAPRVSAAFVGLELKPPPLPEGEMEDFRRLVRLAFARRRKTLVNSLASGLGREAAKELVGALGLDTRCRAETFDLDGFVELCRTWRSLGRT